MRRHERAGPKDPSERRNWQRRPTLRPIATRDAAAPCSRGRSPCPRRRSPRLVTRLARAKRDVGAPQRAAALGAAADATGAAGGRPVAAMPLGRHGERRRDVGRAKHVVGRDRAAIADRAGRQAAAVLRADRARVGAQRRAGLADLAHVELRRGRVAPPGSAAR